MNEDLKRQMTERGEALLSKYLGRKPEISTLTAEDNAKLRAEEIAKLLEDVKK
jgi:hypothetical protein